MDPNIIRTAFVESLTVLHDKQRGWNYQFKDLVREFFQVCLEKDYFGSEYRPSYRKLDPLPTTLTQRYWVPLTALFWEFVVAGILTPGINFQRPTFPDFRITDYGLEALRERRISIYDPSGIIEFLKVQTDGRLDPLVEEYYKEALISHSRGCPRASLVMVGVAAEKSLLELAAAFSDYVGPEEGGKIKAAMAGRYRVSQLYKEFMSRFNHYVEAIQRELDREDLQENVGALFSLIRKYRNDQGHPKEVRLEKGLAQYILFMFQFLYVMCDEIIQYCRGAEPELISEKGD